MKRQLVFWSTWIFYLHIHAGYGKLMTWCGIHEIFCLFYDQDQPRVSNISAAEELCSETIHGSWPLEIFDDKFKLAVDAFIGHLKLLGS